MANYSSHRAEIMRDYKLMSRASFLSIHSEQGLSRRKKRSRKTTTRRKD